MPSFDYGEDTIRLPSGRTFYASHLIVGIDLAGNVSEGYDGGVDDHDWPIEDRVALADLMITRWQAYRAAALGEKGTTDESP